MRRSRMTQLHVSYIHQRFFEDGKIGMVRFEDLSESFWSGLGATGGDVL